MSDSLSCSVRNYAHTVTVSLSDSVVRLSQCHCECDSYLVTYLVGEIKGRSSKHVMKISKYRNDEIASHWKLILQFKKNVEAHKNSQVN